MADIAKKSDIQSSSAFSATTGWVWRAVQTIEKVAISQGAANARLRKAALLRAKSDQELDRLGLRREDIMRVVFRDKLGI